MKKIIKSKIFLKGFILGVLLSLFIGILFLSQSLNDVKVKAEQINEYKIINEEKF